MNVKCPEHQAGVLCDILGAEPETSDPFGKGWVKMSFTECNWALEEERQDAANKGMKFFGYHGSVPGAYPAAIFASWGDGILYQAVHLDDDRMSPVVHLLESTLDVDQEELNCVKEAYSVYLNILEEALGPRKDKDMDFGEQLEARLDCLDNETIIREMGFHDTENVDLLLDYIRVKLTFWKGENP
jgi:hypothetical protein